MAEERDRGREFDEFVVARAAVMRRTAYLLCGDWHRAEDLVQSALVKLYVRWPKIHRDGAVDAYSRQILVRTAIDESRRSYRKRESAVAEVPDIARVEQPAADASVDVRRALAALPPRQRATVVLRYWLDLPVDETARILGCGEGTVKSQSAKGLAALRRLLSVEEKPDDDLAETLTPDRAGARSER